MELSHAAAPVAPSMSLRLLRAVRARGGDFAWVSAGQLAMLVGGFGGLKLLTLALPASAFGEYALGLSGAGVLSMMAFGPLANAHGRLLSAARDRGELAAHVDAFGAALARLSLAIAALTAASAVLARWLWGAHWVPIVLASGALAIGNGTTLFYNTYQTALLQRRSAALAQACDSLLRPGLAVAAVWLIAADGVHALCGLAVASLVNALCLRAVVLRDQELRDAAACSRPAPAVRVQLYGEIARYAAPLALSSGLASLSMYSDRWVLQGLAGSEGVGTYAALYQVGVGPASVAVGAVLSFLVPLAFQRAGAVRSAAQLREGLRFLRLAVFASGAILAAWAAACAVGGSFILRVLSSNRFAGHAQLLPWIALAGLFLSIGQTLTNWLLLIQRTSVLVLPWLGNGILTLGLSLWLGRAWGLAGVVAALVISNFAHLVISFSLQRRFVGRALRALEAAAAVAPQAGPA